MIVIDPTKWINANDLYWLVKPKVYFDDSWKQVKSEQLDKLLKIIEDPTKIKNHNAHYSEQISEYKE